MAEFIYLYIVLSLSMLVSPYVVPLAIISGLTLFILHKKMGRKPMRFFAASSIILIIFTYPLFFFSTVFGSVNLEQALFTFGILTGIIVSVSAAICALYFNKNIKKLTFHEYRNYVLITATPGISFIALLLTFNVIEYYLSYR